MNRMDTNQLEALIGRAATMDAPRIVDFAGAMNAYKEPVKPPRKELGPKQLDWLKQNSPAFRNTLRDTEKAEANAQRMRLAAGMSC